ncbi:MAG: DNA polymerase I, partial [Deltaproteobacteria bacterium]|nr:DNA polymerase I [Deltaproteobacteria bacterium]
MVAIEMTTGRLIRWFVEELREHKAPPFPVDDSALWVSWFATAELGCHLVLSWAFPQRILDLYVEFSNLRNGKVRHSKPKLLEAMQHFGLDSMLAQEKKAMRELAQRGGPYTDSERRDLLDYCEQDVRCLVQLLPLIMKNIKGNDFGRALLRGQSLCDVARIEAVGVPMNVHSRNEECSRWGTIRQSLIETVDTNYGVYDGTTFNLAKFDYWLKSRGINWPRTPTGKPSTSDETFRDLEHVYPEIRELRSLRAGLSQLRTNGVTIGRDGRNRVLISPFGSKTSRNQPSTSKNIFGNPAWLRSYIQPPPDFAVAYVDYTQQEYGVAAALSQDQKMQSAYRSGDVYLEFAKH